MEAVFLNVLNMSIAGSYMLLAVIILRIVLKKAPKKFSCMLWGCAAVRMLLPFRLKSVFSLLPSAGIFGKESVYSPAPQIESGIPLLDSSLNPVLKRVLAPTPGESVNPLQVWLFIAGWVWVLGMGVMAVYGAVSYLRICRKTEAAILLRENIWLCDAVSTPFILGIVSPRIYLPSGMEEKYTRYVLAHEQAHIVRRDHWWKPLGFALLALHWFNPLCWVSYVLLGRDIELACDEAVIKSLDMEERKAYSRALLAGSLFKDNRMVCPLAFGEIGVKKRIRAVLDYKKPVFWMTGAAVVACVVTALCFLTDPPEKNVGEERELESRDYFAEIDGIVDPSVRLLFNWEDKTFSFGYDAFSSYLTIGKIKIDKNVITAKTMDGKYIYNFEILDNQRIRFLQKGSSVVTRTGGDKPVSDGTEFVPVFNFKAKIIEINDKTMLVEPEEGAWERTSADRIQIPLKKMPPSPEPQANDSVEICYNGAVMESYPAQLEEIYAITVLEGYTE